MITASVPFLHVWMQPVAVNQIATYWSALVWYRRSQISVWNLQHWICHTKNEKEKYFFVLYQTAKQERLVEDWRFTCSLKCNILLFILHSFIMSLEHIDWLFGCDNVNIFAVPFYEQLDDTFWKKKQDQICIVGMIKLTSSQPWDFKPKSTCVWTNTVEIGGWVYQANTHHRISRATFNLENSNITLSLCQIVFYPAGAVSLRSKY